MYTVKLNPISPGTPSYIYLYTHNSLLKIVFRLKAKNIRPEKCEISPEKEKGPRASAPEQDARR